MSDKIIFAAVGGLRRGDRRFSFSHWFVLSMALLAVLGFSDMFSVVIRMTLIQLETTDDMRGRVSAVNSLFVIASNQLGDFRAGLVAAWIGTIPAVMVGGIGALLVVLIGRSVFAVALPGREPRHRAALTPPPLAWAGFGAAIFDWRGLVRLAVRGLGERRTVQPMVDELRQPGPAGRVVHQPALRSAFRAAWRWAASFARGRGWSSGTSWRG